MSYEQRPTPETIAPTPQEVEAESRRLWESGARLEAMGTALGRRVDARELQENPDLASVFMLQDANEAYGGLLMVKTIEEMAAERPQ